MQYTGDAGTTRMDKDIEEVWMQGKDLLASPCGQCVRVTESIKRAFLLQEAFPDGRLLGKCPCLKLHESH